MSEVVEIKETVGSLTLEQFILQTIGCNIQAGYIPCKCPIYREYKIWRYITDGVGKPKVVYVDKPDPKKFIPRPKKEKGI